jgi:hypothetical protein
LHIAEQCDRAAAFIGHNKDRIPITRLQMHRASVIAGDTDAHMVEEVCRSAGINLLSTQPRNGIYKAGETIALAAIGKLIHRQGPAKAQRALQILREADCAPVSAAAIKAVEMLLYDEEFAGTIDKDEIAYALQSGNVSDHAVKLFAATHRVPYWRALASMLYKCKRKIGAINSNDCAVRSA